MCAVIRQPHTEIELTELRSQQVRSIPRDFPQSRHDIVAQDVLIAVRILDLEVAMIGSQPLIEHFGNFDLAVAEAESAWRFLAAMACVTLNISDEESRRVG